MSIVLTGIVATVATGALVFVKLRAAVLAAKVAMDLMGLSVRTLVGATGIGLLLIIAAEVYANWETGKSLPVQGRVQRDTQRVALQLGRDGTIVVETGLANLTTDTARLWAHLPNRHSQTWLLVRLKPE